MIAKVRAGERSASYTDRAADSMQLVDAMWVARIVKAIDSTNLGDTSAI